MGYPENRFNMTVPVAIQHDKSLMLAVL